MYLRILLSLQIRTAESYMSTIFIDSFASTLGGRIVECIEEPMFELHWTCS